MKKQQLSEFDLSEKLEHLEKLKRDIIKKKYELVNLNNAINLRNEKIYLLKVSVVFNTNIKVYNKLTINNN